MNRKKGLAFFLVLAMLLVTAIPASPAVTALAAQKNSITELGIKNLPEGNTLKVGDVYNFDPLIIQTELGKGKTTGVVWWEVNSSTNTAGVVSSRWGYVYPVYAGSFEIRALAFPDTASLNAWKKNKTAGAKYITDLTDWVTITVTSDKEGYALARTQSQLNSALANRNCTDIHIETDKEVTFTIKAANYQKKTLTVNAPNAEVVNSARFKEITIEQIKDSTFTERGKGNSFLIKAPNTRLVVEKASRIASVIFAPESEAESPKLNIVGNGGYIVNVSIATKGEVNLQGKTLAPVPVVVEETAAGAKVETGLSAKIDVKADAVIETTKEAVRSIINLLAPKISVSIAGDSAENVRVNIDKEAADTTVTTSVSVEIIAKADAIIEANKGAEGVVIRQDMGVKVEATNNTEEEIVSTDLKGNNASAIKPGENASVVAPTAAPTETPSTPSIPSTPSTPSTPTPTPSTPTPTPSDTLPSVTLTATANAVSGSGITAAATVTDGVAKITVSETVSGSAISGPGADVTITLTATVTPATSEEWEISSYTWYSLENGTGYPDQFEHGSKYEGVVDQLKDYFYYVEIEVTLKDGTKEIISSRPGSDSST
ncbi:MAG: hypothetical protein K2N94_02160 [Lachnospiraceae bacterium]|nr:hypothetical protein [Lachnospiraceae bacterium]